MTNVRNTADMRRKVNRERVLEMFRALEDFSDYERRLLAAKLRELNRGAAYLPANAYEEFGLKK